MEDSEKQAVQTEKQIWKFNFYYKKFIGLYFLLTSIQSDILSLKPKLFILLIRVKIDDRLWATTISKIDVRIVLSLSFSYQIM